MILLSCYQIDKIGVITKSIGSKIYNYSVVVDGISYLVENGDDCIQDKDIGKTVSIRIMNESYPFCFILEESIN